MKVDIITGECTCQSDVVDSGRAEKHYQIVKKKTMRICLALAALAMAGVGAMKTYGAYTAANMSDSELLLMENVEALSKSEVYGGYTRSTGKCKSPCSYKTWVSCKSGGSDVCMASDCC